MPLQLASLHRSADTDSHEHLCTPRADMNGNLSDEALMQGYARGNVDAFTELYERHKGGLYRYLLRQCSSPDVADELFQETWHVLIRNAPGYRVKARFTTWLYRIGHHRLIDWYRRQDRAALTGYGDPGRAVGVEDLVSAAPGQEPETCFGNERLQVRFARALAELPAEQREVFLLREETGMTLQEMAGVLDCPPETAKSRLRYATAKLRSRLGDLYESA